GFKFLFSDTTNDLPFNGFTTHIGNLVIICTYRHIPDSTLRGNNLGQLSWHQTTLISLSPSHFLKGNCIGDSITSTLSMKELIPILRGGVSLVLRLSIDNSLEALFKPSVKLLFWFTGSKSNPR